MFEVWADASVRNGNPGLGGVGIYATRNGTPVLAGRYALLVGDNRTNNEVEYEALIEAIKFLRERNNDRDDCIITVDSRLVYCQLTQGWKCNYDHLRVLRDKAKSLWQECPFNVELRWVKRWDNEIANELAQAVTEEEKLARRGQWMKN